MLPYAFIEFLRIENLQPGHSPEVGTGRWTEAGRLGRRMRPATTESARNTKFGDETRETGGERRADERIVNPYIHRDLAGHLAGIGLQGRENVPSSSWSAFADWRRAACSAGLGTAIQIDSLVHFDASTLDVFTQLTRDAKD